MPKVGGKHFAYSSKGKEAAKAYAKKTGQSVGKYEGGGNVDPFSTRNPEGVPAEQLAEAMENQNMANEGLPTSNAQERSQASPDVTEYKEGGKVEYVDAKKPEYSWEKRSTRKKKGVKGALERIVPGGKSGYEKKKESKDKKLKMRKSYTVDWSKRPGKGQFKDKETGEDVKFKPKKKDKK